MALNYPLTPQMEKKKLTDKYPDLLEVCKRRDCTYEEAIQIIEDCTLLKYIRG